MVALHAFEEASLCFIRGSRLNSPIKCFLVAALSTIFFGLRQRIDALLDNLNLALVCMPGRILDDKMLAFRVHDAAFPAFQQGSPFIFLGE